MADQDIYESIMTERLEAEVSRVFCDVYSKSNLEHIEAEMNWDSFVLGFTLGVLATVVDPEKVRDLVDLLREDAIRTGYLPAEEQE